MITKLTLTMEDETIDYAKEFARKQGKSLSGIVENYFKSIAISEKTELPLSEKVSKMMGVIKLSEDYDYKTELGKSLAEKYR